MVGQVSATPVSRIRFDRSHVSIALARVNPFVDDCAGSRGTFLNPPIGMTSNPIALRLAVHVGTFLNRPKGDGPPLKKPTL